ncbi:MAG TPA: AGE family epimerase/isomerase [Phycisphaerae bacterium]|nr:AGE family epimerase/isomerase [Phycisphaerae bacterium]
MRSHCRLFLGALLAIAAGCAPQRVQGPHVSAPMPPGAEKLADEIEANLLGNVLPAWFPRCIDPAGGFYARFDRSWRPGKGNPKTIVYQARQTWVAATVARAYPKLAATYRGYATHGLAFLRERMWDAQFGGFFWLLPETMASLTPWDQYKHLYGHVFGIYAAARMHRATGDEQALDLARRAFRWMEQHYHDDEHGGYREAVTREGRPVPYDPNLPVEQRRNAMGALYGYKSMNGHIHALEALTELYLTWPDAAVRRRLEELFRIVRDRIAAEPGCLHMFFTRDWQPVPHADSYGHDIETAFLLLEAAEALGRGDDERTRHVARTLVDHALDYGWDAKNGGFYYEGTSTTPHDLQKSWWVQSEGLNALLLMHELFGRQTGRYYEAFGRQWRFIDRYMIDREHGGWHAGVTPEGLVTSEDKAHPWKAAYHNVRALVRTVARLRRLPEAP